MSDEFGSLMRDGSDRGAGTGSGVSLQFCSGLLCFSLRRRDMGLFGLRARNVCTTALFTLQCNRGAFPFHPSPKSGTRLGPDGSDLGQALFICDSDVGLSLSIFQDEGIVSKPHVTSLFMKSVTDSANT